MADPQNSPEPSPESRIGTLIAQRYKLTSVLGEGGIGMVYLAEDVVLGMKVAIKLLKREVAEDAEVVARFDREAKALLALAHENIVQALNFGRTPDGDICLVLEYVEGETLRALLKRMKPMPPPTVLEISRQIAAALSRAHSLAIVHRDLKPENVMVTWRPDGRPVVKMLDFGMARILSGGNATALTKKGAVFGTPEYMPPEQAMGQPVDARADQYAYGVMLFEMIAGQRPFKARNALEMLQMQIRNAPPRLTELVPGLPVVVADVVTKMMAKRPDDRFPDVAAAANALSSAASPSR